MSSLICEKFSMDLNSVASCLMRPPKDEIWDELFTMQHKVMEKLISAGRCDGTLFTFGVMGNSSEAITKIHDGKYEFQVNVKFPFELNPIRDESRPGFVMLQAGDLVEHPAVLNGFLQRDALARWFFFLINKDETIIQKFSLDGDEFIMSFPLINNRSSVQLICKPVLQFDFSKWPLPYPEDPDGGLSFCNRPWYAVPRATVPLDKRSFMVWAPDWERFLMEWNCHASKVLLLMREIMKQFGIYLPLDVVKSIILRNIQILPFDLGNCFLAVFEAFVNDLQEGKVTPFLVDSVNMLQIGSNYEATIEMYHYTASNLLITFKNVKSLALADQVVTGGDNQSSGSDDGIIILLDLFGLNE
ncbi:uncharacterized protein LOC119555304 [Drosophila subpulchrella]|uniref:uncharacterized protein LOC119555304 n=1 Tax=Drosophila subpulchrella TaxID=1486046 RepID=UPI0018A1313D|nr:uncharacterized protein LOC119555304 [Drosophila subpulchrella]